MEQNKEHRQQAKEHKQELIELLEKKDKNVEFLSNTIKDMIPKMGSNNNNTNQFNINMFLNEECKDICHDCIGIRPSLLNRWTLWNWYRGDYHFLLWSGWN